MRMRCGLLLLVFALCGCTEMLVGKKQETPYAQPADDNYVVPGHRIGKIYLGMPLKDALGILGNPTESRPGKKQSSYLFDEHGIDRYAIVVDEKSQTISRAKTAIAENKTPEGIHVGDADARIKAAYGVPQQVGFFGNDAFYCYDQGVIATLQYGSIKSLEIVPPDSCS